MTPRLSDSDRYGTSSGTEGRRAAGSLAPRPAHGPGPAQVRGEAVFWLFLSSFPSFAWRWSELGSPSPSSSAPQRPSLLSVPRGSFVPRRPEQIRHHVPQLCFPEKHTSGPQPSKTTALPLAPHGLAPHLGPPTFELLEQPL